MQEDIEEKTVRLAISSARLTGRVVLEGIRIYLRVSANKNISDIEDHIVGKQSIDELVKQNQGVTSMEIGDKGIKTFERIAKKYGVDFAVIKDKNSYESWGTSQAFPVPDRLLYAPALPGKESVPLSSESSCFPEDSG